MKQYDLGQRGVRKLDRSDGTAKIYGTTEDGKIMTVVMSKDNDGIWLIREIAVRARVTHLFD